MDLEEKKRWVAFNVFEGIGPARFKLLLDYFGSAKKAFDAPEKELREIGLGEKLVLRFINFRKSFDIDSYFLRLRKLEIEILCDDEENYPKLLKEINDKPPVIYVKSTASIKNITSLGQSFTKQARIGNIFGRKAVAVVGTRKVTGYGRQVTAMITEGLVAVGLAIVSGLARGVDEIAHETAIDNNGITIAVLGCGLDIVYPREHKKLAERIVESGGAIISEFPLGRQAVPGNFPARNRIISGLCLGVVVTEAAQDSGSLITASAAAEQGREVFAVPGPITSPLSGGTSELIKKGAKLVSEVADILEELGLESRSGRSSFAPAFGGTAEGQNFSLEEKKIIEILENENLHIDEIVRKTGMDSGKIGSLLSILEIKGIIKNFGEGVYGLK